MKVLNTNSSFLPLLSTLLLFELHFINQFLHHNVSSHLTLVDLVYTTSFSCFSYRLLIRLQQNICHLLTYVLHCCQNANGNAQMNICCYCLVKVITHKKKESSTFQSILHVFAQVKQYTMNPKAMPRQQLLGHIDMDTREWADGVLTNSARNVVREPQGRRPHTDRSRGPSPQLHHPFSLGSLPRCELVDRVRW